MPLTGTPMDRLPAFSRLQQLARSPFDLTLPDALSPERVAALVCRGPGFDLLYATQRVDTATLDALQDLADQARLTEQFLAMEGGAVLNRIEGFESENRQVLHTACRDVFSAPPRNAEATALAREQLENLRAFLEELEDGRLRNAAGEPFTDLIHVGIGGSDLGPRALHLALEAQQKLGRRVHFVSNVDPADAAAVLRRADLARALVLVVSKSGTTIETLTNEELLKAAFRGAGLEPEQHFLAVTGRGSPLDDPNRYRRSFHMFDFVGGRYSATSMVGAVTLAFAFGYDAFRELLRGANAVDRAAEEPDIRRNPPLLLALLGIWNRNFLGCETLAVLPYSQALARFPAHLQQCDMESNGKSVTRHGQPVPYPTAPIVWGEPGTNGQHAFYQLLHQGSAVVPVEFIGFRRPQQDADRRVRGTTSQQKLLANLLAQALALAAGKADPNPNRCFPGNRPSSLLIGDRLTPFSLGALLALYEAKIAYQGFLWDVNSFDQEGVQYGKILATRLLGHMGVAEEAAPAAEAADPPGWALLHAAGILGSPQG